MLFSQTGLFNFELEFYDPESAHSTVTEEYTVLRPSTPTFYYMPWLGRLRIACRYIFNLCQLHQGADSLAQRLEHWIFIWEDRVRI